LRQALIKRLNVTQEEIRDPEIAICDPHHHLWYESENQYQLDNFIEDLTTGHKVVKTVFIESRLMMDKNASPDMQPVSETEYINKIVSQSRNKCGINIAEGIVGFADLMLGSQVDHVLQAHILKSNQKFRGVRHTCAWDGDPIFKKRHNASKGLLFNRKFREGFACLNKYDLNFDAWLFHPQLSELADLAIQFPETKIIVNHTGGLLGIGAYAENRPAVIANWRNGITELAKLPNVFMKLGGLGMHICGFGWSERPVLPSSAELADIMAPFFLFCIEKFGVTRCMFESNFPVDKPAYSYLTLWNAFKTIVADFSISDKNALFHDTAVDVYNI
jgi:L-fuconolactonase